MGFTGRSAALAEFERKASLAGARVPTVSGVGCAVGVNRHVLRQPVHNVASMPAYGLATVGPLFRKPPEGRQAKQ